MRECLMSRFVVGLFFICGFLYAKPMESIERYNIILVHGAADSLSGVDCEASDLKAPFEYYTDSTSDFGRIDGYLKEGLLDDSRSTATGMIKKLPDWINDKILDGERKDRFGIYLNRPFVNPANTPVVNGGEIGKRTWKGRDNCKTRRSLTEEAEEMRNYGREFLVERRNDDSLSYRKYRRDVGYFTHRNILIAHSMGGLASREYVQGDGYNGDVDKVITLDSPHRGTYSLDGLLYMKHYASVKSAEVVAQMSFLSGLVWVLGKNDVTMNQTALTAVATGLVGLNVLNGVVDAVVDLALGYGFTDDDPLADYIYPESNDLKKLNGKGWNETSSMYRVLYGVGGLTFGSTEEYLQKYFSILIPDGLFAMVKNIIAQISHTEIDNPAYWNNILAGGTLGLLGGLSLTDQGSILIPHWSGAGENVSIFEDAQTDVVKVPFVANEHVDNYNTVATVIGINATAIASLYASEALNAFSPAAVAAAKTGIAVSAGAALAAFIGPATVEAIKDMTENHKNPSQDYWHEKQKSKKNSYTKISGDSESVESYLLEDFLYEKPFVNLSVRNDNDWTESVDSTKMDSLGLYGKNGSLAVMSMKTTRGNSLKFAGQADWGKLGVKTERWERVDGLDTNNNLKEKSVPIRHVERYEAPAITIEDWIEKYSFVVDDLMPHRLRQIRMNFNFVTEIAWECDITKAEDDDKACKVYQRSAGEPWGDPKKTVRHPVKKNGLFDFNPRDYGYDNLFAIQKDNQNTVTISTVNKIGLSNTQRFYYLFKATENLLKSNWPTRDVVLNRIEDFEAYASVLNYQGFSVDSAYDVIYKGDDIEHGSRLKMIGTPNGVQDMDFESRQQMDTLSDGEYAWQFRAYATNNATGDLDTSKFYNALFSIDRVAPKFSLYTDNGFVNPDSANFAVRYRWNGGDSVTPDIRAMRWTLEKGCSLPNDTATAAEANCTGSINLPAMYDVAARDFAVSWDKVPEDTRKNLADGLYRIKAYALDYAVPNRLMYDSVNALVGRIMDSPNGLTDADWKLVQDSSDSLNDTTIYAMFRIDRTAPVISDIVPKSAYVVDAVGKSNATGVFASNRYDSLSRPTRDARYVYVSEDSLLELSYKVTEPTSGQDSSVVMVVWNFEHVGESKSVDRAGDSVWVSGTSVEASWKEAASLHLADGIYRIRATVRDRAGNKSDSAATKLVRIDRTAPNIVSLVSRRLVYPDDDRDFSATLKVDQTYDVDSNRTGMFCHYRVTGGDADRKWKPVLHDSQNALIMADSIVFTLDSTAVGTGKGKRYLEVACIDVAGNVSVRTDLFHLGFRSPNIVYPVADSTESAESLIPIVGIAPPLSSSDSLTAVYRLRYKKCGDTDWLDDKIDVIAANRQQADSLHNYSRVLQSTEGVLGYLKNEGFNEDENRVCIELAVASCLICDDWKTDESALIVKKPDEDADESRPKVVFDISKQSFTAGEDSVAVSLRLEGDFNSDYLLRMYAEDEKGVGLKDWSAQKVWRNPYYGIPSDSLVNATTSGVWFYQDVAGTYHLRWKNIGDTLGLQVMYDSKKMGQTCAAPGGKNMESGCEVGVMPFDFISADIAKSYLEDYPEWIPPVHTDSVMKFSEPSGHVVLNAQGAFRVVLNGAYGVDTTKVNIPVYFGNSLQGGFYWVKGLEERYMSPLTTGWTANPQGYGLNFVWDGLAETGTFPAEGRIKLVAEVTENTVKSPHVHVETKELDVKLPALKVVLPNSIPDFYILNKDIDNGDSVAFRLDSMEIRYGIQNRDACVWMYIKDSKDTVVTTLLDSVTHRAFAGDSAYSIRWSGKNAFDTPETAGGVYTVVLKAKSLVGGDSVQTDSTEMTFNVKYAETMLPMTPDDPKNSTSPSIYVSEAKKDVSSSGKYRYEPVADYLLQTDLSGWYLPDSLRDSLMVKTVASGKQKPLGFEAERFSLGILRQRDTLDLVILVDLDEKLDKNGCDSGKPTYDGESHHTYRKKFIRFYKGKADLDTIQFYDNVDTVGNGRAFSIHEKSILNIYAFPAYMKDSSVASLAGNIDNALAVFLHEMPMPERDHRNDSTAHWGAWLDTVNVGCVADSIKDCSYDNKAYNPEKNLFMVKMIPQTIECKVTHTYGGYQTPRITIWDWQEINLEQCPIHKIYFYYELGQVRNGESCYNNDKGFEKIAFTIHLGIPEFYWNAGFGYDNLVNRTIRFDATNGTIYGDTSGYLPAIENETKLKDSLRRNTFFDGSKWSLNKKYGRVTAFETQHLPFFKTSQMDVTANTFLFPGEIFGYESPSHFTIKFYDKDIKSHFVADVVAKKVDGTVYDTSLTSLSSAPDSLMTPMLKHGDMDFYVSFNKVVAETDKFFKDSSGRWIDFPLERNKVPKSNDTLKYYAAASRIHYFVNDYEDTLWKEKFSNGEFFKNLSNMTSGAKNLIKTTVDLKLNSIKELGLADSILVANNQKRIKVALNSDNYDDATHRFYSAFGTGPYGEAGLKYTLNFILDDLDSLLYGKSNDTLYVNAQKWNGRIDFRRTERNMDIPERTNPIRVELDKLYNPSLWHKEVVVDSAHLTFINSSKHSHFETAGNFPSTSDVFVQYKDDVGDRRIPEFVELRAYLKDGETYNLAYLNGNTFYSIQDTLLDSVWKNGITPTKSGNYRLGWFNVNRLQGNTQFLLTWGDSLNKSTYFYSTFDMIVGGSVVAGLSRTVTSPLKDASVTFPENSLTENKDITVRTVDAKDYSFEVFNNLALKGPIVEVLPSMTFTDTTALPRIQMKISREEMVAMRATPQTVRLYKVDFTGKRFVPLQNALYGFLNADGSAVMDGTDTLKCDESNKMTKTDCAGNDSTWAYLLISAETRTFSVFTAMASGIAETPSFSVTVLPEIASTANRTVRVDGISRFRLYVDDDSLWANRGDATPPDTLAFTADSNGFARIVLPSRGKAIDTSYVFVVALGEPDADGNMEELPAAPAVARALTVNAQFACSVPSDSLWLGLDNGYMAYGASCTHPGYGLVSLYREGRVIAEIRGEIPDTIIYDGSKTSGAFGLGKIASEIYESRYVGVSALGMDMQIAGPRVYTDSLRPAIRNFDLQDSSEVLDRIFTATADVYDSESGVARVVVTPVFGGDTLRVMNVLPDSDGHVSASVRLTRAQLAGCTGCYLSVGMRVEDYGHNHAEQGFTSEKLYPYPTELALWYPAREGGDTVAHEFLGTGHDLSLSHMNSPWLSDVGLYFRYNADYAIGNGLVDFGSSPSYSFEARIKRGHPNGYEWKEILSFSGINGVNIQLQQNNRYLRLVEGGHIWNAGSVLPSTEKNWAHVVVTVDSAHVVFYVDGVQVAVMESGISQERELEGRFSMGNSSGMHSYIGNIADIRMYSRALSPVEVEELSKPVTDAGEVSDVIVVAVKDMDAVSGFSNEFSCSVAGNKYLVSGDSAMLAMSVIVENAADYNVVLYARSATAGDKPVYVGESSMRAGTASVANTWRAVTVSGVSVHLAAGTHTLMLKVPAGVQIGGAALTTANIPASMIAWGISTSDKVAGILPADTVRKIKSYLRYEGYPETSTLRPRIRLRNVSNEPVDGFSVRYYFRGEDASQAGVDRYWPNNVATFPAVHSESANTGYVEWTFTETIPVAGTMFGGDGPHFGLYNSDFTPWDASDDPSFVDPNSGLAANIDGFYENAGVIVLDRDNNLIGGSCAEMEDPVSLETKVRVLASDMRGDNQASEIHFVVENIGNVALKNFDVRYYFFVEEGLAPDYEINDKSKCSSASMESLGFGRWQVTVHCDSSLAAGKAWQNPVKVALHLPGWAAMWNANDDPSHDSLGTAMRVARGICVVDSTGYMIYGNTPVWALPAPDAVNPDSVYNVDFGYHAPGSVPVIRTPEGLVITMDNWSYVELSLVTAKGAPVKSIFNGTLAPGEQFVHVDWTGIDMSRTYLMLKVNGTIKSTKKLSLL